MSIKRIVESFSKLKNEELNSSKSLIEEFDDIEETDDDLIFIDNRKKSIINNDPSFDPGFDEYDIIQKGHNDGVITESRSWNTNWREKGLELADEMDREGIYNMLLATFKWMSNDDVGEMLHQNGYLEYEDSFEEALKECLSKLNEAEMSDEDKRDTEILKRIYNKTQERANARLTPEEQTILAKYGLERNSDYKTIKIPGEWGEETDLFRDSDKETNRYRNYYGKTQRSVQPGAKDINYANRARTMPDRKYARDIRRNAHTKVWDLEMHNTPSSAFKKPLDDGPEYKSRFIDRERATLDADKGKKVRSMKWALGDRKKATKDLETIDSTYDAKIKDIKDRYEKELANTEAGRERSRHYSQSSFNRSQETIDNLLGKK